MQIPTDKKSSLQLSIEAELAVLNASAPEDSSNESEISDALGADDFVSKVAGEEAESDQDLVQEFNDSLGGSSEGMLADALEEEADDTELEGTEPEEGGFHVDGFDKDNGYEGDSLTAIYYINTCNGYTEFKTGEKVKSVSNRMVIFDSELEHQGVTATDDKRRVLINFNYKRT